MKHVKKIIVLPLLLCLSPSSATAGLRLKERDCLIEGAIDRHPEAKRISDSARYNLSSQLTSVLQRAEEDAQEEVSAGLDDAYNQLVKTLIEVSEAKAEGNYQEHHRQEIEDAISTYLESLLRHKRPDYLQASTKSDDDDSEEDDDELDDEFEDEDEEEEREWPRERCWKRSSR